VVLGAKLVSRVTIQSATKIGAGCELADARRAPHLTDGYGVVIALTANECAICVTSSGE
jgi:hypothetical protein